MTKQDDERLLSDALLSEPLQDDEQDIVNALTARQSAEDIATAFVRLYRKGKSSPEELRKIDPAGATQYRDSKPRDRKSKRAPEFAESVWFSLSVGRKQNAEPRWLIPIICKAGDITKSDIGAIKLQADETHFELDAKCAEGFMEALGPNRKLEKNIRAQRLDGPPSGGGSNSAPGAPKRSGPKKTSFRRNDGDGPNSRPARDDRGDTNADTDTGSVKPNRKARRLAKFGARDAANASSSEHAGGSRDAVLDKPSSPWTPADAVPDTAPDEAMGDSGAKDKRKSKPDKKSDKKLKAKTKKKAPGGKSSSSKAGGGKASAGKTGKPGKPSMGKKPGGKKPGGKGKTAKSVTGDSTRKRSRS